MQMHQSSLAKTCFSEYILLYPAPSSPTRVTLISTVIFLPLPAEPPHNSVSYYPNVGNCTQYNPTVLLPLYTTLLHSTHCMLLYSTLLYSTLSHSTAPCTLLFARLTMLLPCVSRIIDTQLNCVSVLLIIFPKYWLCC